MLAGGHVGEVLVAALGDEVGLRHHRDAELDEVREAVVGHHGGVLDAVAGVAARRPQRREGDDQLRGRHAVHRDRAAGGVAVGDPRGELGEVQIGVVQDPLAGRQAVHALPQLTVSVRLHEFRRRRRLRNPVWRR